MYLVGTASSPTIIASTPGEVSFDPVRGGAVSSDFLWDLLRSFYRNYLPDRDIITAFWDGVMSVVSGQVQHLWHLEFAQSLRDVPVQSGHKWVLFKFNQTDAFSDPGLSMDTPFTLNRSEITGTWEVARGVSRAIVPLRGEVTEACALSWSGLVRVDASSQPRSSMWLGYQSSGNRLRNALLVGIQFQQGTSGATLCLMHSGNTASADYVRGSVVLETGATYRLVGYYSADNRRLRGEVWDRRQLLWAGVATGSSGETNLTNQVVAAESLEGVVGVGDVLVVDDVEYGVTSVDGAVVTLDTYCVYAEAAVNVEFRGERLVDAIQMDLFAESATPSFTATHFGTCSADLRMLNGSLIELPLRCAGRRLSATTWEWEYLDPTTDLQLLSVPRLTDLVESPTVDLSEGTDYVVVGNQFRFREPPTTSLWAEHVAIDDSLVSDVFGSRVGLSGPSTDAFKLKVQGLYYVYSRGPTRGALRTGTHLLFGLPIATEAGTVEVVNDSYSGTHGLLTISGRDYLYPRSVGTQLVVGDEVGAFEPLSNGVEILTWPKQPHWWVGLANFNEIQKYHTFGVRCDLAAVDLSGLEDIRTFLKQAVPPSKQPLLILYRSLFDRIQPVDLLTFRCKMNLFDTLSSAAPLVRYDSQDAAGEGGDIYDWIYDGSETSWTVAAPGVAINTQAAVGLLEITEDSDTATGEDLDVSLDGTGSKTRMYLLLYNYRSGVGDRVEGENTLTSDTAAFADVSVGGRIWIGALAHLVLEVTDAYSVVLDRTAFVSEAVAWTYEGPDPVWAQVSSVTSATEVVFDIPATIPTGTYSARLALGSAVDVRYDEFVTVSPDERLTFTATISRGYGLTLLSGYSTLTSGFTAVGGQNTGQPDDTEYVSEVGSGVVSGKWVLSGTGRWYRVASVSSSFYMVLASNAVVSESDTLLWLNPVPPLTGTFTFTQGSGTATASTDQTGLIAPGDWIQVMAASASNEDPYTTYPVVQVSNVSGGGLTLSLYEPYIGKSVTGATALKRGNSTALPLDVELPFSATAADGFDISNWHGLTGDSVASEMEEP